MGAGRDVCASLLCARGRQIRKAGRQAAAQPEALQPTAGTSPDPRHPGKVRAAASSADARRSESAGQRAAAAPARPGSPACLLPAWPRDSLPISFLSDEKAGYGVPRPSLPSHGCTFRVSGRTESEPRRRGPRRAQSEGQAGSVASSHRVREGTEPGPRGLTFRSPPGAEFLQFVLLVFQVFLK